MQVTGLKPTWDWIVFRVAAPDKTLGGLHLPENSSIQRRLVVISVGPEVKMVKPGDAFVLSPEGITGSTHITGERLELCREKDVCALCEIEEN